MYWEAGRPERHDPFLSGPGWQRRDLRSLARALKRDRKLHRRLQRAQPRLAVATDQRTAHVGLILRAADKADDADDCQAARQT